MQRLYTIIGSTQIVYCNFFIKIVADPRKFPNVGLLNTYFGLFHLLVHDSLSDEYCDL